MTFRSWFAVPIACLPAVLAMPSIVAVRAQDAPEVVLSDAPAFCQHLQRSLMELARRRQTPLPADVAQLSGEGTRLCNEGSTRAGIMRLRQAMVLMAQTGVAQGGVSNGGVAQGAMVQGGIAQGAQRQTTLEEIPAAK